jgi:5-methylcytosine-specific restriction endonuclease McrA
MREFAESFYKSKAWQDCRNAYAKSRHGLCERCLSVGRYTPGAIVHHRIHLTPNNIGDPSVTLAWDNLMLLCRDCHAEMHKPQKRFTVDDLGRVTAR